MQSNNTAKNKKDEVGMEAKQMFKRSIFSLMVVTLSFALITACGNGGSDEAGSDMDTEMSGGDQTMSSQQKEMSEEQTFEATLEGSNEVPEVETEATGSVTVTLSGDSIHVQGQFSGLSSEYMASHIHKGAEGENGDPVQPLEPELGSDKMSGSFDASYTLSQDLINALKSDSLYVNIHSADHQAGEIRGQLSDSGM